MDLITKIPSLNRNRSLPAAPTPRIPESQGLSNSWKLAIFDVLAVLLAGAVGYGCVLYFAGGANFILFAATGALFLIASFFDFLVNKAPKRRALVVLLQMLAFLAFFYSVQMPVLLGAFAILAVFHFLADRGTRAISENSIKFKLGQVARIYMKKIFVGFALAAIILYLPQWNSGNVFIPQPQFQRWYDSVAVVSRNFNLGLDLSASVGAFAQSVIRTQLATNNQFRGLPEADQERAVDKGVQELIGNTSKNLGFKLTPEMPLSESFYLYIENMLSNYRKQLGDSFLAIWAVALFIIVWSTGAILIWLVVAITYILFEALAAFNVLHVAGETRTKEIIELS